MLNNSFSSALLMTMVIWSAPLIVSAGEFCAVDNFGDESECFDSLSMCKSWARRDGACIFRESGRSSWAAPGSLEEAQLTGAAIGTILGFLLDDGGAAKAKAQQEQQQRQADAREQQERYAEEQAKAARAQQALHDQDQAKQSRLALFPGFEKTSVENILYITLY